jgi:photosystem II stability/assembly factor-like uncharacterized protein
LGATLAGCVQAPNGAPASAPAASLPSALNLSKPVVVDATRIASEPSIKVTKTGVILVAAPTGSVKYATRPQDLAVEAPNGAAQSAIWTSKDNGKTWSFAQMAPLPYHDALPGAGDADLAIDSKGTIYMADQLGLALEVVSTSNDNGATWTEATPLGSGVPDVDRMWMWPDPATAGTVYMNYDHNAVSINVAKTTDAGKTWSAVETDAPSTSPGPIVATNQTVAFTSFQGQDILYTHSEDKGMTWKSDVIAKDHKGLFDHFPITVADTAGTLYVLWQEHDGDKTNTAYVSSHDAGKTWSPKVIAFSETGKALFLWAAAGSPGKLGLSWYESPDNAKFYEHAGEVIGADAPSPQTWDERVGGDAALPYPPCESGTTCTSGRELGDFQQCAIAPDGTLVMSYVIVKDAMSGGHVAFARVDEGPKLLDSTPEPWVV